MNRPTLWGSVGLPQRAQLEGQDINKVPSSLPLWKRSLGSEAPSLPLAAPVVRAFRWLPKA